jgi:hypothetical protein
MKWAGRFACLFVGSALLPLPSCSRQPVLLSPKESAGSLPFNNASHAEGISPTQAFTSSSIPPGTAIAIRLQSSLSSTVSHAGDQFQAVLDGPILVQGQTLAPSGTTITGVVVAARASQPQEPGYLRLALSSVLLNGKAVDVHSFSVFFKGDPRKNPKPGSGSANDVQFSTGRRLTFHLIQPLPPQG